jgi:hypothetical protein
VLGEGLTAAIEKQGSRQTAARVFQVEKTDRPHPNLHFTRLDFGGTASPSP